MSKATAKKKVAKKVTKKKVARGANGKLRKPQVRVLGALQSGKALTRAEISEKGEVDLAMLNSYIGSHDDAIRARNDKKVMPSLLTLKLVRHEPAGTDEGGRGATYVITAAGQKALKAAKTS